MNTSPLCKNLASLPLVIDPKKSRLRIYKQTLALLDNPQYIQLLINPEKKIILLCPATSYQSACERIKWEQLSESKCCEIYSTSFVGKLMLLSNDWDENMSYKAKDYYVSHGRCRVFNFTFPDKGVLIHE